MFRCCQLGEPRGEDDTAATQLAFLNSSEHVTVVTSQRCSMLITIIVYVQNKDVRKRTKQKTSVDISQVLKTQV